jgi:hypothetical protein
MTRQARSGSAYLGEESALAGVVEAEVGAAVHDDALHGHAEALAAWSLRTSTRIEIGS